MKTKNIESKVVSQEHEGCVWLKQIKTVKCMVVPGNDGKPAEGPQFTEHKFLISIRKVRKIDGKWVVLGQQNLWLTPDQLGQLKLLLSDEPQIEASSSVELSKEDEEYIKNAPKYEDLMKKSEVV